MGAFVISKRFNGDFKFIFASRKGKTIFTSISFRSITVCEEMIAEIKVNIAGLAFTKLKGTGKKYSFRLSKEGLVLANSRKYTTELRLQEGIDEIIRDISKAEILDFSESDFVFPNSEDVFLES